ncbi:MAG: hypothetical protein LBT00_11075 [Spirochaetaceae bacterium]|jgi:hypothetical protein|nr:hypothetical protein [Spirochaetaceae bacterium]
MKMKRLLLVGVFFGLVCSLYAKGKAEAAEPDATPPDLPTAVEEPMAEIFPPEEGAAPPAPVSAPVPFSAPAPVSTPVPVSTPAPFSAPVSTPVPLSAPAQQYSGPRMLAVLPFTGVTTGDGEALALLFSNNAKLRDTYSVVPLTRNAQQRVKTEQQNSAMTGNQTPIDLIMVGIVRNIRNNNVLLVNIVECSTRQLIAGDFRIYRDPSELQTLIPAMVEYMVVSAQKPRSGLQKMAVTPFDTPQPGVSAGEAEMLALLLSSEIASSGQYAVLPRIDPLLQAMEMVNQLYAADTYDTTQASAELVLTSSVITLGTKNLFVAQIERIIDGGVVHGAEESYETSSDGIIQVIPRLSQTLTGIASGRAIPPSNTPNTPATAQPSPTPSSPSSSAASPQQTYVPSGGDYRPTVVVPQGTTTGTTGSAGSTGGTYPAPSGGTTYTAPSSGTTYTPPPSTTSPQQYFNPLAPR